MKKYIQALIREQINRAKTLKYMIPHPLQFKVLHPLAEKCRLLLNNHIDYLEGLFQEATRDENLREITRDFKNTTRQIEIIEYYGITPLHHLTPEMEYLNNLILNVYKEINHPLTPPTVCCLSTNYYYFNPNLDVIFVPLGEARFLLHIPDMYHELGHQILLNKESELRLTKINENYQIAIQKLTTHYLQLIRQKSRETGPQNRLKLIAQIHSKWKDWLHEFFSDLFALYTLGPAYAWSHLHLTIKKSENIFDFAATHPSDDARIKVLLIGLKKTGFTKDAIEIEQKWRQMIKLSNDHPRPEYEYAFPNELLTEITELFYNGIKDSNFRILTLNDLEKDSNSISKTLNDAWKNFWEQLGVVELKFLLT